MIYAYLLIAASFFSLIWSVFELWQAFQLPVTRIDPDYPSESAVRVPRRPPLGTLDAFAIPEIDGNDISQVP